MYGPVERAKHAFEGLVFIHPELSRGDGLGAARVRRVRFVDHRSGDAARQDGRRSAARLKELRLEPYDCLSPPLMDAVATATAKASGALEA